MNGTGKLKSVLSELKRRHPYDSGELKKLVPKLKPNYEDKYIKPNPMTLLEKKLLKVTYIVKLAVLADDPEKALKETGLLKSEFGRQILQCVADAFADVMKFGTETEKLNLLRNMKKITAVLSNTHEAENYQHDIKLIKSQVDEIERKAFASPTVKDLLLDPKGCKKLREFAQNEYSAENIDCYCDLQKLKTSWDQKLALKICEDHLMKDAEFAVNTEDFAKETLINALTSGIYDETVFQKIENSLILNITDTYTRFRQKEEYASLILDIGYQKLSK